MNVNYPALVIALLGLVAAGQMVASGSGSPDGQNFRRDEEPFIYWLLLVSLLFADVLLFWFAFT